MDRNPRFKFTKIFFVLATTLLIITNSISAKAARLNAPQPLTTLEFSSTDINSVAVYETGNKVYVGDAENNAIIVLDGTNNQVLRTITGVPEGGGGGLVVNETYGKVYFYTSTNTGVLDATTDQILSLALPEGYLVHDEIHDKLYILNGNASDYNISVLDIATDSSSLLYSGSGNSHGAVINPITNELAVLIYFPARIDFINVDTLAVSSFDIANEEGNHALQIETNTLENKYYVTLITVPGQAEMGIFILDRDTNAYLFVGDDDLEPLVFNPASNTLFSGVQVGTSMGVINGVTDEFTSIDVRTNGHGGHTAAEVRQSTDHAYFVSQNQIARIDKFKTVDFVPTPVDINGGAVGSAIAINQATGNVYVISDNRVGKLFVFQDPPNNGVGSLIKDGGFENGSPNPYWAEYASAGYYYDIPVICDVVNCGVAGAHSGSGWAVLGGWGDEAHLSQTGIIPANTSTLSVWLCIPAAGTLASSDFLTLEIDGDPLFAVTGDSADLYNTYKKVTLDIQPYADGGIHKISFNLTSFSIDGSFFYVDDVALTAAPVVQTFTSTAAQDGWILESSETSKKGGTLSSNAVTFNLGDDAAKKQYLGILSFNTGAALPDGANITSVKLKVKKSAVVGGGNPLTTFQGFMVDIKKGFFGTAALQPGDFQVAASKSYGPFKPALASNGYTIDLTGAGPFINKLTTNGGLTQIRLRFKLDDNNNTVANYLSLFSGNAPVANRPQLVITYTP